MNLSIVIPCYNEGNKLVNNIITVKKYLDSLGEISYEIIGVNDGSTDNTDVLMKLTTIENVKFIGYTKNRGKGYAVKYGIENAVGDWIIFMDADISTDISAIKTVLDSRNTADIIIGSRRHKETILVKKQPFSRKFIGNACKVITHILTGMKIKDTQCGFKAFKKECIKKIIEKQMVERFAFDVEYLYIASINKMKIIEIPIRWENDEDSRVSPIRSSVKFFCDLFKITGKKKYYKF